MLERSAVLSERRGEERRGEERRGEERSVPKDIGVEERRGAERAKVFRCYVRPHSLGKRGGGGGGGGEGGGGRAVPPTILKFAYEAF